MRVIDTCFLSFRLFKKEFIFYFLILFIAVTTMATLLSATQLYRNFVGESFASKQPHFTLSRFQKQVLDSEHNLLKQLNQLPGVLVASPFAKSVAWGQFTATTTQLSGQSSSKLHDKFSSGYFTVIGVQKSSPAIVSWQNLNFYHAGIYRSKMTNLEFAYQWKSNPNLVVPNAVFDASFYPPISQEARIKSQFSDEIWQVKGFLQDHIDTARLYVDINTFDKWLATQQQTTEQGIYIRMQQGYLLSELREQLDSLCAMRCSVSSWMDQHSRKSKVLTVLEVFSWSTSGTIALLAMLLVGLYLAKSIMDKARTINILQITGYRFTGTLLAIVTSICVSVFMLFLLYMWVMFPWMAVWLNTSLALPIYVILSAALLCLCSSLFLMAVFHLAISKV